LEPTLTALIFAASEVKLEMEIKQTIKQKANLFIMCVLKFN
jgi:hypothetical protein